MSNLYIFTNHGQISKQNEHLLYKDCDGEVTRIRPVHTDMIALYGNVSLTAEAISVMAKNQIPVAMKRHGGQNVCLWYGSHKNVFLRMMQYRVCDDEEKSVELSRSIVAGKIRNQISFMQRIKRSGLQDEDVQTALDKIKEIQPAVKLCRSTKSLRGLEGTASRIYFSVFKRNVFPEWAEFESRSKRPPLSNVNAVLSFLYSLLSDEMTFVIESYGLDSMVGTLHELSYSRNSLACDLIEEFRTPIADTICCRLFNDRIMKPDDFDERDGGVYMVRGGMKKVIAAFEQRMVERYREIIFSQVEHYKEVIEGKTDKYEPYFFK